MGTNREKKHILQIQQVSKTILKQTNPFLLFRPSGRVCHPSGNSDCPRILDCQHHVCLRRQPPRCDGNRVVQGRQPPATGHHPAAGDDKTPALGRTGPVQPVATGLGGVHLLREECLREREFDDGLGVECVV